MGTRKVPATAIEQLIRDTSPYLSCDDCFDQVDRRIDALLESGSALPEDFRNHLLGCDACREEGRSLAALIGPSHGIAEDTALVRFDAALAD
jgi:hypothetical protein